MDDEADLEAEIQQEIENEELLKKTEDRKRRLLQVSARPRSDCVVRYI